MTRLSASLLILLLLAIPSSAMAQSTPPPPPVDGKHWGVIASFTPMWKANRSLQEGLFWSDPDEETTLFEGTEFTIGFVRGSTRGGDWGVSYVRKPLKDFTSTSTFGPDTQCFGANNASCFTFSSTDTTHTHNILVDGVEVHFFIPFARFANRVQIGMNVGGGIGFPSGTMTTTSTSTQVFTAPGQPPLTTTDTFTYDDEAGGNIIGPYLPLAKVEFQTSILVARGLKANVAIGMNQPAALSFRLGVVYLFGAR